MKDKGRNSGNFSYLLYDDSFTVRLLFINRGTSMKYFNGTYFMPNPQHGENIMKKVAQLNLFFVMMLVLGLSFTLIGCGDDDKSIVEPVTSTPTPQPTTKTLLDVTVTLNANSDCDGTSFCEDDGLSFNVPEAGETVNISAAGAANMILFIYVLNPDDEFVAVAASSFFSFEPTRTGTYKLWVSDSNEIGGSVHVAATQ